MECLICDGPTVVTHKAMILRRYETAYHRCTRCGYWRTDDPHWLAESYTDAIVAADTGIAERNSRVARRLIAALPVVAPDGPYVDWAGGYGLLVRMMRDAGFDFYWQDAHAENLFARGFEWQPETNASMVTAVEVLEHAPNPPSFVEECLSSTGADNFLFTQVLHTGAQGEDWWYFATANGQHVSFYSEKTLTTLAARLDMRYHRAGDLHLFTRRHLRPGAFRLAVRRSHLPRRFWPESWRRDSLTWADHERMTKAAQSETTS